MLMGGEDMDEELFCGAINPYSKDSIEFKQSVIEAEKLYIRIRNSSTDYLNIADRTRYSVEQILMVKHYIFFNIHQLDLSRRVEYREFDPDLSMAHSWLRLSGVNKPSSKLGTADAKGIEPHDYLLLKHELLEMKFLIDGSYDSQSEAHNVAEQEFNYLDASKEFYEKSVALQKKSTNDGDLKESHAFDNL